jgi:hypothetical protein
MAGEAKIDIDPAGVREILSGSKAAALAGDTAQRIAAFARQFGDREYKRSILVGPPDIIDGAAAVPVGSDSSFWHLFEYGSVQNSPQRPLTLGAMAAGVDFRESAR